MNYIKKLQATLELHKQSKQLAEENLLNLCRYLNSEKFRCGDSLDGYVNIQDVLNHVNLVLGNLGAVDTIDL